MANCYHAISERWKSCFGTDYPLTEDEHRVASERLQMAIGAAGRDIKLDQQSLEGNPAGVDKILAIEGMMGFLSGFSSATLATAEPVWKDRHPEFRSQAQAWILNAPRSGADAMKLVREQPPS